MKWFKHQSDARNSLKLRKVRRKYGADGYAIYWFCLEAIAYEVDKDNLTFDLKEDAETIGFELCIQEKAVEEIMTFMVSIGLFESSNNVITCLKLAESMDKSMTNSPKMRAWLGDRNLPVEPTSVMTLPDNAKTCPELEVEVEVEVEVEKIKKTSRFTPPSLQDVINYCSERKNYVDPQGFIDHYSASGWMRGKTKIKDWKACVRTWEKNSTAPAQPQERKKPRGFGE